MSSENAWEKKVDEIEPEPAPIAVPVGLDLVLKNFAKAVLKQQPGDILGFGVEYFGDLIKQRTAEAAATRPKLNVVICGAPAAGKGTQCARIVEQFGLCHISVGDLLRAEVAAETEAGIQAKQFMDNGDLVPDSLVVDMVKTRLSQADAVEKGWLLDGFPRSSVQAEALAQAGIRPDIFVLINVPDEILVDRVAGRRLDPETGEIYHLAYKPPPAEIVERLIQRSDDTEEKVRTRLVAFHQHTQAVVDAYRHLLAEVDGNRDMEHVWEDVQEVLKKKQIEKLTAAAMA